MTFSECQFSGGEEGIDGERKRETSSEGRSRLMAYGKQLTHPQASPPFGSLFHSKADVRVTICRAVHLIHLYVG